MLKNLQELKQISLLKDCIITAVSPLKVYLFGSFADGTNKDESDYDFYVIVNDDAENLLELTRKAYRAMRGKKNRPVDIIIVRNSKFEERKNWQLSLECEVNSKGYCCMQPEAQEWINFAEIDLKSAKHLRDKENK